MRPFVRKCFSLIGIKSNPSIAFGLVLSVIYILVSSAVAIAYATYQTRIPSYVIEGIDLLGYICVAILIFSIGKDLPNYYLDRFSLILIIVFPGFLSQIPAQLPGWIMFIFFIIPVVIAIILILRLRQVEIFHVGRFHDLAKYFLLGTSIGILFFFFVMKFWYPTQINIENLSRINLLSLINELIGSLSTSASIEEAIIRGFIMGFLIKNKGLKPWIAISIQAIVFWIPHMYQYRNPFLLQAVIPMFGITLGWVTYKTKNITMGIFAHAVYNALITTL